MVNVGNVVKSSFFFFFSFKISRLRLIPLGSNNVPMGNRPCTLSGLSTVFPNGTQRDKFGRQTDMSVFMHVLILVNFVSNS